MQEVHSEEMGGLQAQLEAAKERAAAEQRALQDSLAEGAAREEGLAGQIADLHSAVASLEAALGEASIFGPCLAYLDALLKLTQCQGHVDHIMSECVSSTVRPERGLRSPHWQMPEEE